jgi:hypothetical protein
MDTAAEKRVGKHYSDSDYEYDSDDDSDYKPIRDGVYRCAVSCPSPGIATNKCSAIFRGDIELVVPVKYVSLSARENIKLLDGQGVVSGRKKKRLSKRARARQRKNKCSVSISDASTNDISTIYKIDKGAAKFGKCEHCSRALVKIGGQIFTNNKKAPSIPDNRNVNIVLKVGDGDVKVLYHSARFNSGIAEYDSCLSNPYDHKIAKVLYASYNVVSRVKSYDVGIVYRYVPFEEFAKNPPEYMGDTFGLFLRSRRRVKSVCRCDRYGSPYCGSEKKCAFRRSLVVVGEWFKLPRLGV